MKINRRIIASILATVILSAVFAGCSQTNDNSDSDNASETAANAASTAATESATENNEFKEDFAKRQNGYKGEGYKSLSADADRNLYTLIDITAEKSKSGGAAVTDPDALSMDISNIIQIYRDDHPEVFWLDYWNGYQEIKQGDTLIVHLDFAEEEDKLEQDKKKLDEAVKEALKDAPKDGSDIDKELYVHDWLINNVEYDFEENDNRHDGDNNENEKMPIGAHDAFGALVNKKAVCDGYTRAFQLLCSKLGLNVITVYGQAPYDDGKMSAHTWNAIKLDGDWYYVDVTFDKAMPTDEDEKGEGSQFTGALHTYFNVTTEFIEENHKISPLLTAKHTKEEEESMMFNHTIPDCKATEYSYSNYYTPVLSDPDDAGDIVDAIVFAAKNGAESVDIKVDEELSFGDTMDSIYDYYLSEWLSQANSRLDNISLNTNCQFYANEEMSMFIIPLEYM